MSMLVISEVSGGTEEQDDQIKAAEGLAHAPPEGMRARFVGPTETGWRIVSLWDNRQAFDAFLRDRLVPALAVTGRPLPQLEFWSVERVLSF